MARTKQTAYAQNNGLPRAVRSGLVASKDMNNHLNAEADVENETDDQLHIDEGTNDSRPASACTEQDSQASGHEETDHEGPMEEDAVAGPSSAAPQVPTEAIQAKALLDSRIEYPVFSSPDRWVKDEQEYLKFYSCWFGKPEEALVDTDFTWSGRRINGLTPGIPTTEEMLAESIKRKKAFQCLYCELRFASKSSVEAHVRGKKARGSYHRATPACIHRCREEEYETSHGLLPKKKPWFKRIKY